MVNVYHYIVICTLLAPHLCSLRSPKNPDAEADMGVHEFVYAIMPHAGVCVCVCVFVCVYMCIRTYEWPTDDFRTLARGFCGAGCS